MKTISFGWLVAWGMLIWGSISGIIMVFHANVLLGVAALFIQGSGFLEWAVYKVSGYDIALHVARAVGLN